MPENRGQKCSSGTIRDVTWEPEASTVKELDLWVAWVAQWVEGFAAKADDLSSSPGSYITEEENLHTESCPLTSTPKYWCVVPCAPPLVHKCNLISFEKPRYIDAHL